MRTLSANAQSEAAKSRTTPRYLVQLGYVPALYLSTSGNQTWNGQTWTANGIRVDDILFLAGGVQSAHITLPNTDNSAGALILTDGIDDIACDIWELRGAGPHAVDDVIHVFSGVLDSVDEVTVTHARLSAVTDSVRLARAPRLLFDQFCNFIPAPGSTLTWAALQFKLERRGG